MPSPPGTGTGGGQDFSLLTAIAVLFQHPNILLVAIGPRSLHLKPLSVLASGWNAVFNRRRATAWRPRE